MAKRQLLKGLKRPQQLRKEESSEVQKDRAQFIAEPFERGVGTSIGNTLRRILLSSIEGSAITAIHVSFEDDEGELKSLSSEFDSIPNVKEDTLEIIGNLKNCHVKVNDGSYPYVTVVEIGSSGVVSSAQLSQDKNITIYNPTQHILTLNKDAKIIIELQIDKGIGYRSAEELAESVDTIGTIPIDALFSPVLHVGMNIEKVRIGQQTDYDKLILDILTDGTITPSEAISEASIIAKEHLSLFIDVDESEFELANMNPGVDELVRKVLNTTIDSMELSARANNCLTTNGIVTIGELISKTESELSEMRNFGKKSLDEIKERLLEWNLRLGIKDMVEIANSIKSSTGNNNETS